MWSRQPAEGQTSIRTGRKGDFSGFDCGWLLVPDGLVKRSCWCERSEETGQADGMSTQAEAGRQQQKTECVISTMGTREQVQTDTLSQSGLWSFNWCRPSVAVSSALPGPFGRGLYCDSLASARTWSFFHC